MTIWTVSATLWIVTAVFAAVGVYGRNSEFGYAWIACSMMTGACAALATFIAVIVLAGVKF